MGYDFAYGNTRIRGMRSKLLGSDDLSAAARCKDIRSFVALLERTPYKEVMSELKGHGRREVEKALFRQLMKDLDKLGEMAPDGEHDIFEALRHKYEIENIKTVLAAKISKAEKERIREGLPFPVRNHELINSMLESDLDGCIELLQSGGYDVKGAYGIYKSKGAPHVLFAALDKNHYSMLWKTLNRMLRVAIYKEEPADPVKQLKGYIADVQKGRGDFGDMLKGVLGTLSTRWKSDRIKARDLVGVEIDFVNFINILRAKKQGYDVRPLLLPQHRLRLKEALGMTEEELFREMARKLYVKSVSGGAGNLAKTERQAREYVFNNYKDVIGADVLGIGAFLGYLKIKEQEVWNLVAICNSIGFLEEKEIEELLL